MGPLDRQIDRLGTDWRSVIDPWRDSSRGRALVDRLDGCVAAGAKIYPAQVFRALEMTPLAQTRVVILGQDPYHSEGQAEGMAFSVPRGTRIPPSLRNIFKELQRDMGVMPASCGHLGGWAAQGVLLLNSSLTVEDAAPGSHAKWGWHELTDKIVCAAAQDSEPKVFMLWGAHAQSKAPLIYGSAQQHLVLQCNHPSPLAANRPPTPFVGSGHFGQATRFLAQRRPHAPVLAWSLEDPH
jgi:uracil-DNA glycosylase